MGKVLSIKSYCSLIHIRIIIAFLIFPSALIEFTTNATLIQLQSDFLYTEKFVSVLLSIILLVIDILQQAWIKTYG